MTKMNRIMSGVVLISLFLFSACSTIKYVPINTKVDSIYVEKIVERVDTISIQLPAESKEVAVLGNNSHLETFLATSDAWVDSLSILHHNLVNKPENALKKEIVYKDKIIEKEVLTTPTTKVVGFLEQA